MEVYSCTRDHHRRHRPAQTRAHAPRRRAPASPRAAPDADAAQVRARQRRPERDISRQRRLSGWDRRSCTRLHPPHHHRLPAVVRAHTTRPRRRRDGAQTPSDTNERTNSVMDSRDGEGGRGGGFLHIKLKGTKRVVLKTRTQRYREGRERGEGGKRSVEQQRSLEDRERERDSGEPDGRTDEWVGGWRMRVERQVRSFSGARES